jgi:hypothetical protein
MTIALSSCSSKETNQKYKREIDGKLSFAVDSKLEESVGIAPHNITLKETKIEMTDSDSVEIRKKADALLLTLHSTHQLNEMPLKDYITITYELPNDHIKLLIPYTEFNHPERNIYMRGIDSSKDEYYLLKGGEKETLELIGWFSNKK